MTAIATADPLAAKVAVVTGAGRGIGAAIALRLAAMGATMVVNDLDRDAVDDTTERIVRAGGNALGCPSDISRPDGAAALVAAAGDAFGRLDIVVNNAGITDDAMIHKMTDLQWDRVMDVCLRGGFNVCRSAYPLLRGPADHPPADHRKVVNIASINGVHGAIASANYSAAKSGLIGLTRTLAREWARHRINVNAVAPGFIEGTRLSAERGEADQMGLARDVLERVRAAIPIGRGGTPQDVAGVVAFLASPDSDFVTGQVIEAHGGLEVIAVFS